MFPLVVNALVFQVVWFMCVALRLPWAVPAAAIALAIWFFTVRPDRSMLRRLLLVVVTGVIVDSVLTFSGVFRFSDTWSSDGLSVNQWLCPPWLMCLWLAFATTVGVSLKPLIRRLPLAIVLGAVAGPIAYYVGSRLGAMEFGYSTPLSLGILALVWAVLLPLASRIINVGDATT